VGLLIWLFVFVFMLFMRGRFKLYLLFLSPWFLMPLYSFCSGVLDYTRGKATHKSYGLVRGEFYNLDPQFRVWNYSKGCMVNDSEPFTQTPNNIAIKLCTKLFGIQPGVYKGYYPNKQVVFEGLKNAQLVKFEGWNSLYNSDIFCEPISFAYNGENIKITTSHVEPYFKFKTDSARVMMFNNECIAFQPAGDSSTRQSFLIDRKKGEIFAYYY